MSSKKLRILVCDTSLEERDKLVSLIRSAPLHLEVRSFAKGAGAAEALSEDTYDICFIGRSFDTARQLDLLEEFAKKDLSSHCGFIPYSHEGERTEIMRYIEKGAHCVLVPPASALSVQQAMHIALEADKIHSRPKPTGSGAVTASLPVLLEGVAMRLEQIAERVEARIGRELEADNKVVKEALLGAIALGSNYKESEIENLVSMISQFLARNE